jgi:hypothetical protein
MVPGPGNKLATTLSALNGPLLREKEKGDVPLFTESMVIVPVCKPQ